MITVKVIFCAQLREEAGLGFLSQAIDHDETCSTLYKKLAQQFGFSLNLNQIKVAINEEFVDEATKLNPGDEVAFLPPFAGG